MAPRVEDFRLIADLGDVARIIEHDPKVARDLIFGRDAETRVVRAGYRHPRFGHVILEYLLNEPGDRHPVAVATSAEALGLPIELWTEDDHRQGRQFADQSRELLREVVARTDPLYGGIGVEFGLPTPTELRAGRVNFPTELYVSRALLGRNTLAVSRLEAAYGDGDIDDWEDGRFYACWTPFVQHETQKNDYAAVTQESRAALSEILQSSHVAE